MTTTNTSGAENVSQIMTPIHEAGISPSDVENFTKAVIAQIEAMASAGNWDDATVTECVQLINSVYTIDIKLGSIPCLRSSSSKSKAKFVSEPKWHDTRNCVIAGSVLGTVFSVIKDGPSIANIATGAGMATAAYFAGETVEEYIGNSLLGKTGGGLIGFGLTVGVNEAVRYGVSKFSEKEVEECGEFGSLGNTDAMLGLYSY